ncbi:uncharacterized protein LOC134179146 [Corticium candelabrum]|uniref:uncharacterized protein LOC134179146 n=1 Tax=Corticium candelabrum TaxID=121492 RepID=UPI002E259ECC|nr:uncharacterized protein LOC134179146 [Corticium candelabrum]
MEGVVTTGDVIDDVVAIGVDSVVTAGDVIDDVTIEEDSLVVDTTGDVVGNVVAIGVDSVVTADDVVNDVTTEEDGLVVDIAVGIENGIVMDGIYIGGRVTPIDVTTELMSLFNVLFVSRLSNLLIMPTGGGDSSSPVDASSSS